MNSKTDLFNELRNQIEGYLSPSQVDRIHQAYLFASKIHKGQVRQSGEPYISHPLAVTSILASMRLDDLSIIAAILHDVLEESTVTKKELQEKFGPEVAELVDGVSKLTQIKFESRAEAQAENFRKMLLAMTRDIRVILVKLADRLHNMRTLGALPLKKRHRIGLETLEIYAPIANRLGMHNFRIEFEDLGFAAVYPLRYRILKKAVEEARGHRKEIVNIIKNALKKRLEEHGIPASSVIGRQKHLYSIYKKMRLKHLSFSEIMDVYAFRIVVDDIDTCYRTLGVVHGLYKPLLEKFKDYIALPKANGYQSLHTTLFGPFGVPIEIQVRTVEMDYTADNGIAAHWLYKSTTGEATLAEIRAREWLKGLLDLQKGAGNPLEFIENVKIDLFPNEVYLFTPKGKIMELPNGATAIDFAYAIHSDVGNSTIGVKIDRRIASLSTPLANGQTIEIITSLEASPDPNWLSFVVTGKAKSAIRHFIKSQKQAESIALGHQLITNALSTLGSSWKKLTRKNVNSVLKSLNYKTIDDLCEATGFGEQIPLLVAQRLLEPEIKENIKEIKARSKDLPPVLIKGSEGMVVHFAPCCRPIPGDSVVGYLESGRGIVIHLKICKRISKLSSDKCIPVQWAESIHGNFKVDLSIEIPNEQGMLAHLATTLASSDTNIESVSIEDQGGRYATVNLTLSVHDRDHLAKVIKRIRGLEIVSKISRTK